MLESLLALVFVTGTSTPKITEIAQDFANSYWNRGAGVELTLYSSLNNENEHVVRLESPGDFVLFNFLVNYISYPKGKNYRLHPRGYWTVDADDSPVAELPKEPIMIFVPSSDRERDNVYVVTQSGVSMKLGFAYGNEYVPLKSGVYEYQVASFNPENYSSPVSISSISPFLRRAK